MSVELDDELEEMEEEVEATEEDEIIDTVDAAIPEHPIFDGLDLAFEDRPVIVKRSRQPRVEPAWEDFLAVLQTPARIGKSMRVFSFVGDDAKAKAGQRARSMRSRLVRKQPGEMWLITTDEIKDSDEPRWNVYASYEGPATDEEILRREEIHEARVANGQRVSALRFPKAEA